MKINNKKLDLCKLKKTGDMLKSKLKQYIVIFNSNIFCFDFRKEKGWLWEWSLSSVFSYLTRTLS